MKQTLKYRLLDNGIDSIKHGIEHFLTGEKDNINYKYAILSIFHGLEMILKEKLLRINPILIYNDIDKEINEDQQTVGFDRLYIRLKNTGIELRSSDYRIIKKIQKIRNQIEHKEVAIDINETKLIIGSSIEFLIKFMRKELGKELKDEVSDDDKYKTLVNMINFFDEQIKLVEEEIEKEISQIDPKERSAVDIAFCPECNERTIIIRKNAKEATCRFCKEKFNVYYCINCSIPILKQYIIEDDILCDVCKDDLFGEKK